MNTVEKIHCWLTIGEEREALAQWGSDGEGAQLRSPLQAPAPRPRGSSYLLS